MAQNDGIQAAPDHTPAPDDAIQHDPSVRAEEAEIEQNPSTRADDAITSTRERSPLRPRESAERVDFCTTIKTVDQLVKDEDGAFRRAGPYLVLVLQAAVVIFILVALAVPIPILNTGTLSTQLHTAYVAISTLVASGITLYTRGQVQILWLQDVLGSAQFIREEIPEQSRRLSQIRNLLSIGSIPGLLRFRQLALSKLFLAAMVAAMTAGVSPSQSQPAKQTSAKLTAENPGSGCWVQTKVPDPHQFAMPTREDSSVYLVPGPPTEGVAFTQCPADRVLSSLANTAFDAFDSLKAGRFPEDYLYRLDNAVVGPKALGVPEACVKQGVLTVYGGVLKGSTLPQPLWWTGCAPVVASNPVNCQRATNAKVTKLTDETVQLVSADGVVDQTVYFVPPQADSDGTIVSWVKPTAAGQAQILIGGLGLNGTSWADVMMDTHATNSENAAVTNSPSAATTNSQSAETTSSQSAATTNIQSAATTSSQSAATTNSQSAAATHSPVVIQCTVDIKSSLGSRKVIWNQLDSQDAEDLAVYGVDWDNSTGDASCDLDLGIYAIGAGNPLDLLSTDYALATPLFALQKVLDEGITIGGFPLTLSSMGALRNGHGQWQSNDGTNFHGYNLAFAESPNLLSDALGVVVAAALSFQWRGDQELNVQPPVAAPTTYDISGWLTWPGERVGPGEWWGIVFIIPEVFAIVNIVVLLVRRRRHVGQSRKQDLEKLTADVSESNDEDEHQREE